MKRPDDCSPTTAFGSSSVARTPDEQSKRRRFAAGFSLVELMVAMVIGLLGIIVMMQVFTVFEGQKRTTTSGDDAISTGNIALFSLQRNIQSSGWGISSLGGDQDVSPLGCTVAPSPAFATALAALPLVPVTINSPLITVTNDDDTDTLLIVSGSSSGSVEGDEILGPVPITPKAFDANDYVFSVPLSSSCTSPGRVLGKFSALNFNNAGEIGVRLYNLGPAPIIQGYAIRGGNLTTCDFVTQNCATAGNWVTVANNVVSLRAQYGRDTSSSTLATRLGSMDGVVDVWDQAVATPASPVSTNARKNTTACAWARVTTLRIALVARSSQAEKAIDVEGDVHITQPVLVAPGITAPVVWMGSDSVAYDVDATQADAVRIVLPLDPPDATWPKSLDFRYKVFQTVIPLRNVVPAGTAAGVVPKC